VVRASYAAWCVKRCRRRAVCCAWHAVCAAACLLAPHTYALQCACAKQLACLRRQLHLYLLLSSCIHHGDCCRHTVLPAQFSHHPTRCGTCPHTFCTNNAPAAVGISPEELCSNPALASKADGYGLVDGQGSYLGPEAGAAASVAAVRGELLTISLRRSTVWSAWLSVIIVLFS
jgi:hypothetical protein